MLETFIIDGKKTEINVLRRMSKAELLEVTAYSDRVRNYIHSGFHFIKIEGRSTDGYEIDETFLVLGKKDGLLSIKKLTNDNDLKFRVKQ
jgi:hypothetical protein